MWSKYPLVEELTLLTIKTYFKEQVVLKPKVTKETWEKVAARIRESCKISDQLKDKISGDSIKNFYRAQKKLYANSKDSKYSSILVEMFSDQTNIAPNEQGGSKEDTADSLLIKGNINRNFVELVKEHPPNNVQENNEIEEIETTKEPQDNTEGKMKGNTSEIREESFQTVTPKSNTCELCNKRLKPDAEVQCEHFVNCVEKLFVKDSKLLKREKMILNVLDSLDNCYYCKDPWNGNTDNKFKMNHLIKCGNYHKCSFQTVISHLKSVPDSEQSSSVNFLNLPWTPKLNPITKKPIKNAFDLLKYPAKKGDRLNSKLLRHDKLKTFMETRTSALITLAESTQKRAAESNIAPSFQKTIKILDGGSYKVDNNRASLWELGAGSHSIPEISLMTPYRSIVPAEVENLNVEMLGNDKGESELLTNQKVVNDGCCKNIIPTIIDTHIRPTIDNINPALEFKEQSLEVGTMTDNNLKKLGAPSPIHGEYATKNAEMHSTPSKYTISKTITAKEVFKEYQDQISSRRIQTTKAIATLKKNFKKWVINRLIQGP